MTIVFVSNYFNHHQRALSNSLFSLTKGKYTFISTAPMRQERSALGYGETNIPDYVWYSYKDPVSNAQCQQLIDTADVVIAGSSPESMLAKRIRQGKLTLRYMERPFKKGQHLLKYPLRYIKWHFQNPSSKPVYLLCASAYASADYHRYGLFSEKCFRWGYFPQKKTYDSIQTLLEQKNRTQLLWVGRFLDWKHPDDAVYLAEQLRNDGYTFQLSFVGCGEMEDELQRLIAEKGLDDCVRLLGPMKPQQVREYMERAGIFLFTSDRQEGWGAVLNEAMNSGCAVVSSDAAGAVPYLLSDQENGLAYHSGDVDELHKKVKRLLDHPEEQQRLGEAAYSTIANQWNAEVAACRLIQLAQAILSGEKQPDLFETGPCSRAEIVREDWFAANPE